jgi:hypothetical protein
LTELTVWQNISSDQSSKSITNLKKRRFLKRSTYDDYFSSDSENEEKLKDQTTSSCGKCKKFLYDCKCIDKTANCRKICKTKHGTEYSDEESSYT